MLICNLPGRSPTGKVREWVGFHSQQSGSWLLATVRSLGMAWEITRLIWLVGRFISRRAVPDTSRRKAKLLWAGKRWTNCSSLDKVQIWESSFSWSCNLKHSYTSAEDACILTLSSIVVHVLIPCRVRDIFLILQSSQAMKFHPHAGWSRLPQLFSQCHGWVLLSCYKKSQKCQIYLLLTSLTCTLLILM